MPIQSVLSKTYYYGSRYRDLPIVIYRTVIYNWLQLPLVELSVCTISMACLIKPDIYPTIQLRNLKNRIERKGEGRKLKIKESIRKEKKKRRKEGNGILDKANFCWQQWNKKYMRQWSFFSFKEWKFYCTFVGNKANLINNINEILCKLFKMLKDF